MSVDRIYIYMAMGRLRPKDGLISMKDLQVCVDDDGYAGLSTFVSARSMVFGDSSIRTPGAHREKAFVE